MDFPFKVSPAEMAMVKLEPDPPAPIILVGRSGTGKTTCIVYRMWVNWIRYYQKQDEPFHQIFITASATLKEQVGWDAKRMRTCFCSNPAVHVNNRKMIILENEHTAWKYHQLLKSIVSHCGSDFGYCHIGDAAISCP